MKQTCQQVGTKENENVIPARLRVVTTCIVCHSSLSGIVLKKDAGQASMTKRGIFK